LERFYDPDAGNVIIDNYNLKMMNLRDYRRIVGYVGQEPVLFNTSIKENILYGNIEATD
jgi:ABC-type multidrug transport system fused ATPase/permease subunit